MNVQRLAITAARILERRFEIGNGAAARAIGPEPAISALAQMLPRYLGEGEPEIEVDIRLIAARDGWEIWCNGESPKWLRQGVAPVVAAEQMFAVAAAEVARRSGTVLLEAAVLARHDVGVAIVGDDIDSRLILALHLHARGWRAVSFQYSFLEPDLNVSACAKLISIPTSALDDVPRTYRGVIEASPWYDSGGELVFYAVDARSAGTSLNRVAMRAVLILDGDSDEVPTIDVVESAEAGRFLGQHPLTHQANCARLKIARPIPTSDTVESWICGLMADKRS